ncbi:MAG TPA: glycosyltransferase family 39 protein [Acidimicrobiales bacterium]|jgi:hypothetical protein|nr:glycosyltransferase family 39 protein [Acidimicrobiales bacterium]
MSRPASALDPGPGGTLPAFDRRVIAVGAAVFVVLMGLSGLYGFHRDELYFLDCGRHLAGSYVDQPVLTPLLARVSLDLFGVSLPGLRVWPALADWATILVAGLIARELGGRSRAQLLAAAGVATSPAVLAVDHLFGPTAFDVLAWAVLAFVVVRVGRSGNSRWWILGGLDLGLGLANKHSIGIFAVALLAGIVIGGGRRRLLNRWALGAVVIAGVFTVPDLWWQAGHHWATIAMTRSLSSENGGAGHIPNWVAGQLIMVTLALVWLWVVGWRRLWASADPLQRSLAWTYGILFVFFAVTTGAKIYYLLGAYVYLLAAGAVTFEERGRTPADLRRLAGWTALSTVAALPLVLPVLPASDVEWTYGVNQVPGESIGWNAYIAQVAQVWHGLPAPVQAHSVLFTADYGEAGAINELGRTAGLPGAVSGQNNEWWWGPGDPNATTVIAIAPGPRDVTGYDSYLSQYFTGVRVVATISNPDGVHNQEWGGHIYICTGPRRPWAQMWPALRHYD